MSSYESTQDAAARKAEETKNAGQYKAGQAQQATKVRDHCEIHISSLLASVVGASICLVNG